MISEAELTAALERHWGLADVRVEVHNGGMGSQTWFVEAGGRRWVAKAVAPIAGAQFAGGLAIAQRLDQAGIRAGAAVPARAGELAVVLDDGSLALLTWVPGSPLTGASETEQRVACETLVAVHRALAGFEVPGAHRFHWVDPAADYLSLRPWLRPAIVSALEELGQAGPDQLTWGLLHADPAPDAFRWDAASRQCGVIDWSYALRGPLLYDLASAVMYVGGPEQAGELIRAYLAGGTLGAAEVEGGLRPMLRFRWAVQANYFAWRIATNDMTGIGDASENEKGLEDARLALTSQHPPG